MTKTATKSKSETSEARQRIIETAKKLFYSQGYLATGINQVIAEAKVAKNTFYYYFPSKEDLCIAYLDARHTVWVGWLNKKIEGIKKPFDKILGLFDYLQEWMQDCKFRGCAFLNIASEIPESESKIREKVSRHKAELHKVIESMVKDLKDSSSKYKNLKVKETAEAVYVLFEGAIVSSQNFDDTWPITAARKSAKILLSEGN